MKRISIFAVIFMTFVLESHAQKMNLLTTESLVSPEKVTNAYTVGGQAESISGNFENLFRKLPRLIANPDSIRFLDYKYITTIQNNKEIQEYFYKNWYDGAPVVMYYVVGGKVRIDLSKLNNFNKKGSLQIFNKWIAPKVHIGYKVYRVDFILEHKKINHYVFVNPKTNKVVKTIFTFFGSVPKASEFR